MVVSLGRALFGIAPRKSWPKVTRNSRENAGPEWSKKVQFSSVPEERGSFLPCIFSSPNKAAVPRLSDRMRSAGMRAKRGISTARNALKMPRDREHAGSVGSVAHDKPTRKQEAQSCQSLTALEGAVGECGRGLCRRVSEHGGTGQISRQLATPRR